MNRLLPVLLLAGCGEPRLEEIPTSKLASALADVKTLKAPVLASIHGFEKSGGFQAQIVWRAPYDFRVRCSHFEFASGGGKFQLWLPDDNKFLRGSLEDFRKSARGELFVLFDAVLPRRPAFFAYAARDGSFYGIADDAVVRFGDSTPLERFGTVRVRYESVHAGVPVGLVAWSGERTLHLAIDVEKMKIDGPVRDELFEMSPPDGSIVEEFHP